MLCGGRKKFNLQEYDKKIILQRHNMFYFYINPLISNVRQSHPKPQFP